MGFMKRKEFIQTVFALGIYSTLPREVKGFNNDPDIVVELEMVVTPEEDLLKHEWFKEYYRQVNRVNTIWNLEMSTLYKHMSFEEFEERFRSEEEIRDQLLEEIENYVPNISRMFAIYIASDDIDKDHEDLFNSINHPKKQEIYSQLNEYIRERMKANGITFSLEEEID